jgi:HlyD family secretion protein
MHINKYKYFLPFIISIAFIFVACSEEEGRDQGGDGPPLAIVEAIQIDTGSLPLIQRLTGEMRARNQIEIYPEISARITEVRVSDGDHVSEGDTLVRLRDDDIREQLNQARFDYDIAQAQVNQAEASLRRLEAQYDRTKQLAEMELESDLELETIQADIDEAVANVELAKAQKERAASQVEEQQTNLENTVVRAPIDGVVGNRNAEVGQSIDSGTQLFQIGDIDNMRIFVSLTETMSDVIEPGHRAELVSSDGGETRAEARVARISPFLDPVTHTTIAELEVEENQGNLRPGMFVTLDIYYGEAEESVIIPKTAIYDHPIEGETGVYIAEAESMEMEFDIEDDEAPEGIEGRDHVSSNPVNVEFVPVEVLAEGRGMVGVTGIDYEDGWVVTVGQNQLAEWESEQAHIRMVDWEHVMELQNLQTRDMEELIFGNSND